MSQPGGLEILENPAPSRFQLLNEVSASSLDPSTTSRPVLPDQPAPCPTRQDLPSTSGGSGIFHASAGPAPNHSDPAGSHQFRYVVESDSDHQPRFSAAEKGKQPANSHAPMLDYESASDEGEMFRGSVTPTPHIVSEDYSLIDENSISDTIGR